VEKRGRTGKKGAGWHPPGGDTRVKSRKSDSDESDEQKNVVSFSGENRQGWQHRNGRDGDH